MGRKAGNVVSRYSFSIYLIHFLILSYYVNPVLLKDMAARHYILRNHGFYRCDLLFIPGMFHGDGLSGSQAVRTAG